MEFTVTFTNVVRHLTVYEIEFTILNFTWSELPEREENSILGLYVKTLK